ncbi:HNH endonuclease family protein [Mycobacterium hubeiense]|uniref:HNH endonuclease family protein n=1 Tax=Mycobacterium hubeiense TaxID=1867256 RepID=UPI001E3A054A|nr:HNH endonuclease family protein [Mycobacterium sp. QGD 101]
MKRWKRRASAAATTAAALWIGWTALTGTDTTTSIVAPPALPAQQSATVAQLLRQVAVIDELPQVVGYERSCKKGKACVFGPAWNDPLDRSGCDTRQRVLRAQLTDVTFKPGTRNCKVVSGVLHDPYTGTEIRYSSADPDSVEIDHIAALSRVWHLGAWRWTAQQRQVFANDTDNLLAVSGAQNSTKSDAGLREWLPPNQLYVCPYIEKYLAVMVKYQLPITRSDRDVAARSCAAAA